MASNVTLTSSTGGSSPARLYWIDWMKAIGMGLIVYGHFSSLYDIYVYVFSVPLFFLISGFLSRRESDRKVFWKKLFFNLIVPLLIICPINYLIKAVMGFIATGNGPETPLLFLFKMIIGRQGALGPFWFVYTLVIIKVIFQFTTKTYLHIIWIVCFLFFAYIINNHDIVIHGVNVFEKAWAIPNTFVAYPFFIIGHYFRKWKDCLASYKPGKYTAIWMLLCLFVIFICGHDHKYVYLYECGYGDNIFLFLLGGVGGSGFVYFISKVLERFTCKAVTDISVGTTIILGFHIHLVTLFRLFFRTLSVADVLFTVIIMLAFIPVIRLCASYIPILMGKYRTMR